MRSAMSPQRSIEGSRHRMVGRRPFGMARWSPALINVVGLMMLLFFMGGSSRPDVWSLPILRPIAVLSLFYGLWSLSRQDFARHRFLFSVSAAVVALIVASLIPLPPFVWTALAGRDVIVAIDGAAGLSGAWRPISMAPDLTWNALFALVIPLAILTNGVRLSTAEHRIVIMTVLLGGGITMAFALLQIVGGGDAAFYLYRHSSFGEPSGVFANRNHEALFLASLLPLLGFLLATRDRTSRRGETTRFLAFAGSLVTLTFILVLGSRAGLVAGLIGLISFALIAALSSGSRSRWMISRTRLMIGAVATIIAGAIIASAIAAGSARSIQRLLESDDRGELRYIVWPIIRQSLSQFMPAGTGIGTFERVFRTIEPDAILSPTYLNHAHNDWLEVALTGGAPGIVLMLVAVIGYLMAMARVWSLPAGPARAAGWMGLVMIFMAAIGSIIDYPLRAPILSALFALSCVWVASGLSSTWSENGRTSDRRNPFEGRVRR